MIDRLILHVDIDMMFASAAKLEWPETAGQADLLIVGGKPDERGVVTSASYSVRAFGVRAGMPTSQALRLCPKALLVPVPGDMVRRKSREVFEVVRDHTPLVEQTGVDEGYADLTSVAGDADIQDIDVFTRVLRHAVFMETGMTVSCACASNKLVAKCSVEFGKPGNGGDGVVVIGPGEEEACMLRVGALSNIPGIGPSFQKDLERIGFHSVKQILPHSREALASMFGERRGGWLWRVVRGIDQRPVELPGPPKSISREDTFLQDIFDDEPLARELDRLLDRAIEDLSRKAVMAQTVTVRVKDSDFRARSRSRTMPFPTADKAVAAPVAAALLEELRRDRRVAARLVGISFEKLSPASGARADQIGLFEGEAG